MNNNETGLPAAPQEPADTTSINWRSVLSLREMGVYYALLLLVLVLSALSMYRGNPNYLSVGNLSNVMYQASLVAIMAVAMTVVLISGNFDLSVASVAALAAALLIGLADRLGFFPAALVAMTAAISIGLINGMIVQYVGINAFIVTLGTLTAVRGLVLVYTDGRSLSVQMPEVVQSMVAFESGRFNITLPLLLIGVLMLLAGIVLARRARKAARPIALMPVGLALGGLAALLLVWFTWGRLVLASPVIYMLAFVALVWFVLTWTVVGRRLYAAGGNPEAARLSGINVVRYKLLAFVLCSGAAGFAGILFASRLRSVTPTSLQGVELTVIAAAILGGTSLFGGAGSVVKTLAGALLLYSLTNGFNILNLGANYQSLIEGIVVIAAAAIYTLGARRNPARGH